MGGTQRLPLASAALLALVAGTLMVLSMRISIPVCAGSSYILALARNDVNGAAGEAEAARDVAEDRAICS